MAWCCCISMVFGAGELLTIRALDARDERLKRPCGLSVAFLDEDVER